MHIFGYANIIISVFKIIYEQPSIHVNASENEWKILKWMVLKISLEHAWKFMI